MIALTSSREESSVNALLWAFKVPTALHKVVDIDTWFGGAESWAVSSSSNTLASEPCFRHLAHGAECSSNLVNVPPVQQMILANLLDFLVREHGNTLATWSTFWSRGRTLFYFESCLSCHVRSEVIFALVRFGYSSVWVLLDLNSSSVDWFRCKCDLLPFK